VADEQSERSVRRSTAAVCDEAAVLVGRLEDWAFVREKVIDRLDIRAARAARQLAASVKQISSTLRKAPDGRPETTVSLVARLKELETQAREMMGEAAIDERATLAEIELDAHDRPTIAPPPEASFDTLQADEVAHAATMRPTPLPEDLDPLRGLDVDFDIGEEDDHRRK
jgi:hypothetical protein